MKSKKRDDKTLRTDMCVSGIRLLQSEAGQVKLNDRYLFLVGI